MSAPNDEYKPSDAGVEAHHPADTMQDEYNSRTGQDEISVQSDSTPVKDPIDPASADSDQILARDESKAIDQSNIINSRTRGGAPTGSYREPGDEEGLGGQDDGRSAVAVSPN